MLTTDLKQKIIQLFIIAFLVLFPHYVPLPFYSYAVVCLALIIFYLKKQNKSLRHLGLKRNGLTIQTWMVGILSALFWIAFNKWVYHPFITYYFDVPPYTEYDFIRNHLSNLVITILAAWIVGGFYEEIVFRGFIQTTFQVCSRIQNIHFGYPEFFQVFYSGFIIGNRVFMESSLLFWVDSFGHFCSGCTKAIYGFPSFHMRYMIPLH